MLKHQAYVVCGYLLCVHPNGIVEWNSFPNLSAELGFLYSKEKMLILIFHADAWKCQITIKPYSCLAWIWSDNSILLID